MSRIGQFSVFSIALFVSLSAMALRWPGQKIEVKEPLKSQLNSILSAANDLHSARVSDNEFRVVQSTRAILDNIQLAHQKANIAETQAPHLRKILEAVRTKLEMSQVVKGEDYSRSLKGAFKDLVQLAQVFRTHRYKIFFCEKDESLWLQSGYKPKNPIHPQKYSNCGKLVN